MSGEAVRFTAVDKRFGATAALAGLTFDVAKGEMFGLIGPDGAIAESSEDDNAHAIPCADLPRG